MGGIRTSCGILSALIILSLIFSLYTGVIVTLISDNGFYLAEFERRDVYSNFEDNSMPPVLARQIVAYFRSGTALPPEITYFSLSENLHLGDVKLIILNLRNLFYISSAMLVAGSSVFILAFKGYLKRNSARLILISGLVIIGTCMLLLILALNFSVSFTGFHKIFFPQGNWKFPMESGLIRLFPEQFFLDAFLAILFRVGFFGLLLIILGVALQRHNKRYNKRHTIRLPNQKEL